MKKLLKYLLGEAKMIEKDDFNDPRFILALIAATVALTFGFTVIFHFLFFKG
jgi:hypothetical protein